MIVTKEKLEKLIEDVKNYDQDTGITSITTVLKPHIDTYSVIYIVVVVTNWNDYEFEFRIHSKSNLVEARLNISDVEESYFFDLPLELPEEPISFPQLLRTIIYKYHTELVEKANTILNEFNSTVLYED